MHIDIYFHHHSIKMFDTLVREQAGYYNTFIIMPEINNRNICPYLSKLDQKNTFLLDVGFKEYKKEYPGVYQNFEKDIYSILKSNQHLLSKYKRLFLIFPEESKNKRYYNRIQ